MKRSLYGCTLLLISMPMLFLASTAAYAAPYLVHVSDTPPNYTMSISGGGYDTATVSCLVNIPGPGTAPEREKLPTMIRGMAASYSGKQKALPSEPPKERTFTVKPMKATNRTVFAALPQGNPLGYMVPGFSAIVWLKDAGGTSNPLAVNRTKALFLMKNTSRPGELNRLYGFNLKGDPYVPNYLFMRRTGGGPLLEPEIVPQHKEDGVTEQYCIQFRLPADLPEGDYQVFAHNNSGAEYGFSEALQLTVSKAALFKATLYSAAEYGVVGDSVTDNIKPLQALVDKAGAEGGGIVFLPPGSYRLSNTLQLRQGVVLRGAGRDATTIFFEDDPAVKKQFYWFISARDVDRTAIEDMTIRIQPPMSLIVSYYKNAKPSYDLAMRRCRLQGGLFSMHYGINVEISDNIFENALMLLNNMKSGIVRRNEFTLGRLGGSPVSIWASENCTIENNRVHGSNRGYVWQLHGEFGHYRNYIDANLVETTRMGGNSGETYLFEGSGFKWHGRPGVFTAAGFSVPGAGWKPDALKNAFAVVVDGAGIGQYVRITGNTDDTATLERPWPVIRPQPGTAISVLQGVVENIFINNRDVNCDNSVMFYTAGIINNRIQRHRSENALGISVWSHAEAARGIFVPDYYNIFQGNVIEDQGSFWMTVMGDIKQETGVRNLNNIYRSNFVSDTRRKRENQYGPVWEETRMGTYRPIQSAFWMDIGRSYEKDRTQTPIWIDTLIEHNYITRCDWGVELRPTAGGTLVKENTFFDVKLPVIDQGKDCTIDKNRFEQPVYDNPPPWATIDRK